MKDKDSKLIYEAYQPLNEGKIKQIITALDAGDSVEEILKDLNLPHSAKSAVQAMHDRYYEKGEKAEDNIGTVVKNVAKKAAPHLKEIGKQALAGMAHSATDAIAKKAHSMADKVAAPSEDASSCPSDEEMEPTQKTGDIEMMLTKMLGGRDRRSYIRAGKCVMTGKDAGPFRDELSKREYMISGMGQEAQDQIFGPDDEDEQQIKKMHIEDQESTFVHTLDDAKTRFRPTELAVRYDRKAEGKVHERIQDFVIDLYERGLVSSETEAFKYIDSYMDQIKKGHVEGVPDGI